MRFARIDAGAGALPAAEDMPYVKTKLAPHDAEMIWLLSRAKPLGVRAVRCCWVLLIVAVRRWI